MRVAEGLWVLWADSLGAKSFSVYVGGSCGVLVDPGAAAMHPSFPLPGGEKRRLRREALGEIARWVPRARLVVVTHYHYDHYVRPWDPDYPGPDPYSGRLVVAKDPNVFINESQRGRVEELLSRLLEARGHRLGDILGAPEPVEPMDPEESMPLAAGATSRGRLEAGRRWYRGLVEKWSSWPRIPGRIRLGGLDIVFADGGSWEACGVRVRLLGPHFHGDIYERTGWVVPLLLEYGGLRVLYTSDLMGPLAEDYAEEIIRLRPDIILADGPATYLPPYMYSRRDLERAKANMTRIIREAAPRLIVWDHHLPREPRWRERVAEVYRVAERVGVRLETVACLAGRRSVVEEAASRGG